jgi:hypothetical protein
MKHNPREDVFINNEWCLSFNRSRGLPRRSPTDRVIEGRVRLTLSVAVMLRQRVIDAVILRVKGGIEKNVPIRPSAVY